MNTNRLLIIAIAALLLIICTTAVSSEANTKDIINEKIEQYAEDYSVDPELFKKVVKCESNYSTKALNPQDGGSRSVGLLQFKDATFNYYSRKVPGLQYIDNYEHQIQVAMYMWEIREAKQWSCYRKLVKNKV